ncbi:MAG: class B sortase [Clostridiales bacterium]|nr:class B sortase [Clostridiales bacterium]
MRSDRDHTGRTPRRNPSVPVPGMPYRLHPDREDEPPAQNGRDFGLIESKPPSKENPDGGAYNPWQEMGWQGGETAFPVAREPEVLQEEKYFKPMLDISREMPDVYDEYSGYNDAGNVGPSGHDPEFFQNEPEFFEEPPPQPPPPPKKKREPWRIAVILSCVAGLLFCAVEVYRIARDVLESETQLNEYRELYLKEHNEDFSENVEAVALRPAGETYPPTASPVPVSTPTPTARIEQNDPLIAAMNDGADAGQSVEPGSVTPAPRYRLDRYPDNPLLIVREEIAALQAENPDVVGRLVIDGILDETVVMRNNTYYLNHNALDVHSGYGAVFADQNLIFRRPPENILLYGRTSYEGKTFAPLKNYVSGGVDFGKQHAFLSFDSLYEEARYVIVAVISSSSDPASADYFDTQALSFATDEEMLDYAARAIERSQYGFDVGVQATDRLLTLVTVSDGTDTSRIIIVCRMLREGEYDGYIQSAY